jgi:D-amino-acid dehydrogenase
MRPGLALPRRNLQLTIRLVAVHSAAMKIVIIGSGLIGLTTAYFLSCRGQEVTVIDRQAGPGLETSFANGALLTPSMAEPWNAPGSWRLLLASLGRSDAPMQLRLGALPALAGWGISFLRNSRRASFERNTLSNVRLGLYSRDAMESVRAHTHLEYGRSARGALKLFRNSQALEHAWAAAQRLVPEGLRFRRLSRAETLDLEPALAPIGKELTGAIHYQADETGDAYRFCAALAQHLQQQGVEFRFDTDVSSLQLASGRVTAVRSGNERFVADRYIVAAGSYSTPLLRGIGIRLPVRPVKGYSVTLARAADEESLRIPIVDDDFHAAVVPLAGAIRVAGTAEFAGYDRRPNPSRTGNLVKLLQRILPRAHFDLQAARPWNGLRPMSPDGVPLIGSTPVGNVLVSTGHGHLGWTLAAGSARLLADLLCAQPAAIDPAPYDPRRFA